MVRVSRCSQFASTLLIGIAFALSFSACGKKQQKPIVSSSEELQLASPQDLRIDPTLIAQLPANVRSYEEALERYLSGVYETRQVDGIKLSLRYEASDRLSLLIAAKDELAREVDPLSQRIDLKQSTGMVFNISELPRLYEILAKYDEWRNTAESEKLEPGIRKPLGQIKREETEPNFAKGGFLDTPGSDLYEFGFVTTDHLIIGDASYGPEIVMELRKLLTNGLKNLHSNTLSKITSDISDTQEKESQRSAEAMRRRSEEERANALLK